MLSGHRAVLETFVGILPNKPTVNHIDGNNQTMIG